MSAPLPLYRGQGNTPFTTSQPESAAKRGQVVPYNINGAPSGATLTPRTISATGDAAWGVTFDGSANVSSALTLVTVNPNTGTFGGATTSPQFSVDGKGRVTSVSAVTIAPAWASITSTPTTLAGYGIVLTSGNVTTALGYTPTSVTGLTGAQSVAAFKTGLGLVKADVGLGSVDNTSDATKAVLSATKLTTPRTINGVAFDGSANITIPGSAISVVTKTSGYTETTTSGEIVILASFAAGGTIVLPTAVGNTAKYTVKKLLAASTVVIDANASETIDGGLTATLTNQYEAISFVSDNANWWII